MRVLSVSNVMRNANMLTNSILVRVSAISACTTTTTEEQTRVLFTHRMFFSSHVEHRQQNNNNKAGEAQKKDQTSNELVVYENLGNGIASLTLNNPKKRNALSIQMMESMLEKLLTIEARTRTDDTSRG